MISAVLGWPPEFWIRWFFPAIGHIQTYSLVDGKIAGIEIASIFEMIVYEIEGFHEHIV